MHSNDDHDIRDEIIIDSINEIVDLQEENKRLREALEKQRVRWNLFSAGGGANPRHAVEEINDALEAK